MTLEYARNQDAADPLKAFRSEFLFPKSGTADCVYLTGNSLGLQPRKAREYIIQELEDWERYGVEGHFHARKPWLPYHENLTEMTARLVGGLSTEVVVMNTLTVNLHLMMVSFYRPSKDRFKILIEAGAFPSDRYAVESQLRFHGLDPAKALVELRPRPGESTLRHEDVETAIDHEGHSLALVLLGNVNYLTGQAFDMKTISQIAHHVGAHVGFDLAHGVGNLNLKLHDDGPDFAVWCSYKYLNGGPGTIAGCFVHERHAKSTDLPRFAGWWGHDKASRFQMGPEFKPIEGAEGWQLSNPPIFQLAALRASLEIFDRATMPAIRKKGDLLTGYLEFLIDRLPKGFVEIVTPRDPRYRGNQLSLRFSANFDAKALLADFQKSGVVCDFREPNIMRAAPAPLYVSFEDVHRFAAVLEKFAARSDTPK